MSDGSSKSRTPVYLLIGLGGLVALGVGGWFVYGHLTRLRVVECYTLDMVVTDQNNRQLKTAVLGVRTKPTADDLNESDLEVVAPDGQVFADVKSYKMGRENWLTIPVPEKYVTGGGLKLRRKSSGQTADLPAKIEPKKIDDIK